MYKTSCTYIFIEYCFDSLHFHWGVDNEHGSEHTINGKQYPLELHLVHYSCDYYMITEALHDYHSGNVDQLYDDTNVLAVIGILFEIGEPNIVLQRILDDVIIDGVSVFHDPSEKYGEHLLEIYYDEFNIMALLPDNKEMIQYEGSLTTPPCYEVLSVAILFIMTFVFILKPINIILYVFCESTDRPLAFDEAYNDSE